MPPVVADDGTTCNRARQRTVVPVCGLVAPIGRPTTTGAVYPADRWRLPRLMKRSMPHGPVYTLSCIARNGVRVLPPVAGPRHRREHPPVLLQRAAHRITQRTLQNAFAGDPAVERRTAILQHRRGSGTLGRASTPVRLASATISSVPSDVSTDAMTCPTCSISASPKPRVVTAVTPIRNPLRGGPIAHVERRGRVITLGVCRGQLRGDEEYAIHAPRK